MAKKRGFGGIVNTNGVYDFSGKTLAAIADVLRIPTIPLIPTMPTMAKLDRRMHVALRPVFALLGVFK